MPEAVARDIFAGMTTPANKPAALWLGLAMVLLPGAALADTTPATTPPPVLVPTQPTTTQYDPRTGFPDHNGPFSAMIIVIPQEELTEFDGDAGGSRHLDRVSRAEAGARLAIKLVFIGMQADWNGNANITYDLQVFGPDGKIYAASDYRNIDALHDHIGAGQGVFDNRRKIVLIQFDAQDAPGLYTLKAVLHDNVAKRDIPLQTGVELIARAAAPAPGDVSGALSPDMAKALTGSDVEDGAAAPPAKGTAKGHRRRHRRH